MEISEGTLGIKDIYPLRIIKQIASMFCSVNRPDEPKLDELRKFVLDKERVGLDKSLYKICLYLTKTTLTKQTGMMVMLKQEGNHIYSMALSEIVAYIKSNKSLIDSITTGKVNVSDIVDNLTTNVSGKPLSAAQGVKLKALIDAIVVPSTLPNPQPLVIIGESYDGSTKKEITIQAGEGTGGANIDDTTVSSTTTYSSEKIEEELKSQKEAIDEEVDKKANDADLAAVAKSGSYEDLKNKPTIPAAYTLPTASTSVLGGVKVGSGLSIDANGVLSLNVTNASGVSF